MAKPIIRNNQVTVVTVTASLRKGKQQVAHIMPTDQKIEATLMRHKARQRVANLLRRADVEWTKITTELNEMPKAKAEQLCRVRDRKGAFVTATC